MSLSGSLLTVVGSGIAGEAGVDLPGGYTYAGDGQYVSGSGGTTMVVEYLLGGPYELGAEASRIMLAPCLKQFSTKGSNNKGAIYRSCTFSGSSI